jgi:hypothetical protein
MPLAIFQSFFLINLRPLSWPQATCYVMCAVGREVTFFANMTSLVTLRVACGNDKAACAKRRSVFVN